MNKEEVARIIAESGAVLPEHISFIAKSNCVVAVNEGYVIARTWRTEPRVSDAYVDWDRGYGQPAEEMIEILKALIAVRDAIQGGSL